ncbi:DNA adenine methylase [bacterium]|nr:DNA adenine methylase [bacterium]
MNNKSSQQNIRPQARPFLKWAGGKTQLIDELIKRFPEAIKEKQTIDTYIEPFIGGGALFFYLKGKYIIKKSYLSDINQDLVIAYRTIKKKPRELIKQLKGIESRYLKRSREERESYFYKIRKRYNIQKQKLNCTNFNDNWIKRTAYLIFLNKTCFNGLFRLNNKGEFNVPHGKYANPAIADEKNILAANRALKNTEIYCGDFTKSKKYIQNGALIYCDPPYRPLNSTSSFTGFTKEGFSDEDQARLAEFYKELSKKKDVYLILSNSDPQNIDPDDTFFDELYKDFNIDRVEASRVINCDSKKRGLIKELIITGH